MLDTKDQVLLLLEEALPLLVRHGLWPTLSSAPTGFGIFAETLTEANCRSESLSRDIVMRLNTGSCKRLMMVGYSTVGYSAMLFCALGMLANGACPKLKPDLGWPQMTSAASGSRSR